MDARKGKGMEVRARVDLQDGVVPVRLGWAAEIDRASRHGTPLEGRTSRLEGEGRRRRARTILLYTGDR